MDKKKRKRGIKASREKLEIAMLNAGIKTQASLAERIAENEKLPSPPKDTVNRVFRGQSVSPTTLTRIARALNVEPGSLYQSAQDPPAPARNITSPQTHKTGPLLGKYSLAINCVSTLADEFAQTIQRRIKKNINAVVINPTLTPEHFMAIDIARHYKADGVISIRSQPVDRFLTIQIFLFFEGIEQLIWSDSLPACMLPHSVEKLAQDLLPYLNNALGATGETTSSLKCIPIEAQEKYLAARVLISDAQSETSLQRAQTLLRAVLDKHPEFARAQAALADCYIRESWRSETKELLELAQQACDKALQIAPDDGYIHATQSHLLRITGRIPEAIAQCDRLLQQNGRDVDLIDALANAYLEAYNQNLTEIPDAKMRAQQYARKLVELEPQYWKNHLDLGNTLFNTGDTAAALSPYEISAQLNPNELAYINLGVMSLCHNQRQKSLEFFTKAHELKPGSYLGYEFLGLYYFFMSDFAKAIDNRKKAIDSFLDANNIGIHQIWGDLADAYRLAGNQSMALESYRKALEIIDRDILQGYAEQSYEIHQYYYYFQMSQIQPFVYPSDKLTTIVAEPTELLEQDLSAGESARLAIMFEQQKRPHHCKLALEKSIQKCPGMRQHPELKPLAEKYLHAAEQPSLA